jgi:hypothetical protein
LLKVKKGEKKEGEGEKEGEKVFPGSPSGW